MITNLWFVHNILNSFSLHERSEWEEKKRKVFSDLNINLIITTSHFHARCFYNSFVWKWWMAIEINFVFYIRSLSPFLYIMKYSLLYHHANCVLKEMSIQSQIFFSSYWMAIFETLLSTKKWRKSIDLIH